MKGAGDAGGTWWRPWRIAVAAVATLGVAACAFAFRFNALGGVLGGFDNDHFTRLIRADVMLQGEQPLRDFVDAELRGAWPALTYAASEWAQQVGGRTLLSEAYLTVGLLAFSHALVFLLALDLSKRWFVALLAVVSAMATMPKIHNYPKVFTLVLGVWVLRVVASRPTVLRLAAAALVTAIATVFRHDYGVYVAAGIAAALVARDIGQWHVAVRSLGIYAALTAAWLLPSAIWVQLYVGIPEYVRTALATVAAERTRTPLFLEQFDLAAPFAGEGPEFITYYAFRAVPVLAAVALIACMLAWKKVRLSPQERATAVGLIAMVLLVNMFFLRANLSARLGDAAVPVVLLAAWIVGAAALWTSPLMRVPLMAVPVALLAAMILGAVVFSNAAHELDTAGLSDSWGKTTRRFHDVREELSRLPPVAWSDDEAQGTLQAARYVAECTSPDDRLLVIGRLHEIPVFARRRFAAGQPLFELSLYTSEADQRRALAVLATQSVPIVLADTRDFDEGFIEDYPLVARHIADHYRNAGTIDVDHEPRMRVLVQANREASRMDPHLNLPCFK